VTAIFPAHDAHWRPPVPHELGQRDAVHPPWHVDVSDDQPNIRAARQNIDGLFGMPRLENFIACFDEHGDGTEPKQGLRLRQSGWTVSRRGHTISSRAVPLVWKEAGPYARISNNTPPCGWFKRNVRNRTEPEPSEAIVRSLRYLAVTFIVPLYAAARFVPWLGRVPRLSATPAGFRRKPRHFVGAVPHEGPQNGAF